MENPTCNFFSSQNITWSYCKMLGEQQIWNYPSCLDIVIFAQGVHKGLIVGMTFPGQSAIFWDHWHSLIMGIIEVTPLGDDSNALALLEYGTMELTQAHEGIIPLTSRWIVLHTLLKLQWDDSWCPAFHLISLWRVHNTFYKDQFDEMQPLHFIEVFHKLCLVPFGRASVMKRDQSPTPFIQSTQK